MKENLSDELDQHVALSMNIVQPESDEVGLLFEVHSEQVELFVQERRKVGSLTTKSVKKT